MFEIFKRGIEIPVNVKCVFDTVFQLRFIILINQAVLVLIRYNVNEIKPAVTVMHASLRFVHIDMKYESGVFLASHVTPIDYRLMCLPFHMMATANFILYLQLSYTYITTLWIFLNIEKR